jgi:hypothetical protein
MLSFTFRIGGGAYTLENMKGKRHKTYQLKKRNECITYTIGFSSGGIHINE